MFVIAAALAAACLPLAAAALAGESVSVETEWVADSPEQVQAAADPGALAGALGDAMGPVFESAGLPPTLRAVAVASVNMVGPTTVPAAAPETTAKIPSPPPPTPSPPAPADSSPSVLTIALVAVVGAGIGALAWWACSGRQADGQAGYEKGQPVIPVKIDRQPSAPPLPATTVVYPVPSAPPLPPHLHASALFRLPPEMTSTLCFAFKDSEAKSM